MFLKTRPGLRLSDFTKGVLEDPATGQSLPTDPLLGDIAAFFSDGGNWDTYPDAADLAAISARDRLVRAGLMDDGRTPEPPALAPPRQTMFGTPNRHLEDIQRGEIVFLGAPIDVGTTGYPGTRFGPESLRMASVERFESQLDLATGRMHGWNVPSLGGSVLGGARISDLGNLLYPAGEPPENYYVRLRSVVDRVYEAGAFPVILGGDHSITYSTVSRDADVLVHIDAHCDLAELVPNHCHHHGNVLRRLLEDDHAPKIHHFGLRETGGWDTEGAGTFAKSAGDLELPGWSAAISGKSSFVSLDVDVLDPTVLPGTGSPSIGGLTLRQLCQVLTQVAMQTRPIGIDVVELCPMRDPSGLSESVVIEAILAFLAQYFRSHGSSLANRS